MGSFFLSGCCHESLIASQEALEVSDDLLGCSGVFCWVSFCCSSKV